MKSKLCTKRCLKNISYFLVPIFIILILLSITSIIVMEDDIELKKVNNYYESSMFTNQYLNCVLNTNSHRSLIAYRLYEIAEENAQINYDILNTRTNFIYLYIDEENNEIKTNVERTYYTDSVDEIKSYIEKNAKYWNYEKGEVNTNINSLQKENIYYNSTFSIIKDYKPNITIYTALLDGMPYKDEISLSEVAYNVGMNLYKYSIVILPLSIIGLIVGILFIFNGIGRTKKYEGIHLTSFDKWKLEVVLMLLAIIILAVMATFVSVRPTSIMANIIEFTIGGIVIYVTLIILLETIVKRIKTHTLLKNTVIYLVIHNIAELIENRKITTKLLLFYGAFCITGFVSTLGIIESYSEESIVWVIILVALGIGTFYMLFKKLKEFKQVQEALKSIYEGNTEIYINPNELKGALKQMAIYIDDIAGGLSNAIQENLKSERLKTELITNVSHDIKTPLTSIINYIDLLKKEKIPNEKVAEYLMVLENKSQRLKKLTEDLIEASKASSGNIKLTMETLNVVELVKQVSGEFEDRFKEKNLEEVITVPQTPMYIEADGRYIYRVLENIYSNVAKYALENTRVYLDVIPKRENVVIQMKNISKEKLNISADELMQRFVRGESSRNTEGSGLGLSIATSLTELQGGKFQIYLDGDLFKVTIEFKIKQKAD